MELLFPGAVIRRERLRRNWSQEGLCRGICAVSYLSKIEQGKTEASSEILHLLFARLELPWYDDEETLRMAESLIGRCYEALLSCDDAALQALQSEFSAAEARLENSPRALDAAILRAFLSQPYHAADETLEPFFDRRQLALQRLLQGRHDEALRLFPCAYLYLMAGLDRYETGRNYAAALEYLSQAYDMAAQEGRVRVMLFARMNMGSCYCNQLDVENMNAQYRVARRLARALDDQNTLRMIAYNTAATYLESGRYDAAYDYFAAVEQPTRLDLHKLAICCEKLGRREQALAALDRAGSMPDDDRLSAQMCELVRFRLEHEDYLRRAEYGQALLQVFGECRRTRPIGYAAFHLPWVLEWYSAARQYRAAYELIRDFPIKLPLK